MSAVITSCRKNTRTRILQNPAIKEKIIIFFKQEVAGSGMYKKLIIVTYLLHKIGK